MTVECSECGNEISVVSDHECGCPMIHVGNVESLENYQETAQ